MLSENVRKYSILTCEIGALYHKAAVKVGLSDTAMQVLYIVCMFENECLLSDVIRLSEISKQTVHSAVSRLEKEEFLVLKEYDKRKKLICLTEKGEKLAQDTVVQIMELENEIMNEWTKEEQEQYIILTERYFMKFKESLIKLENRLE
ncbi:MAG: winged helix DNA-binding protein [Lachnospiraceae bacterium]|nr:winged helix DNA-binding protein [Lachnospiraceae bacterium]